VKHGIHRVVTVAMQDNGASLLLASQQCPMAYINQGHAAATNNVKIVFPKHPFDPATEKPAYKYIQFVVKTESGEGVRKGDEFTTDYGWNAENLPKLKELYTTYLKQLSKARPGGLRQYDMLRAQHTASAATASPDASSVITEGSCVSNSSTESQRRRAALEHIDNTYWLESAGMNSIKFPYDCFVKQCHTFVSHTFITKARYEHTFIHECQK